MATDWQIGDRIQNRWEIHKILRGGMGVVYIVYDHEWRDAFAAKTFQDEIFARNPVIASRFTEGEALAWVNLDAHQNIAQVRFVETIHGKPYLFLEYVSGGDLSGWIGTPRLTQDLPQVLRFAIHFCDGMAHALSKGIKAHRDIKPQNCLITEDRALKITDFGLAKLFDDAGADEETAEVNSLSIFLTRTGAAAGTPTHMAPEQFDDAKHVDVRADIYSFGVMLYQMLTGRLPFVGRTWEEYRRLHKTQQPPALITQHSALKTVIETCLAKDPAHRFADFSAVREKLAEIYEELTGETAPEPVIGVELSAVEWSNKGVSLSQLGRLEEAIECCDKAIEINPRFAAAWTSKGSVLGKFGRLEEAIECCDKAIEINPRFAAAWYNKGNALGELGRLEEAIECCDKAIEINPRDEKARYNKGVALDSLGRLEEAIECYDRALEINPRFAEPWYNKGVALSRLGRSEEAIECYDCALEINPRLVEPWYNKGITLGRLGRLEEMIECCDKAIEINPRDEKAWGSKGAAVNSLGRLEEAIECYDRALEINLRFAEAWYNKGNALGELGRLEEAIECCDKAIEINPRYAEAWYNKGAVLFNSLKNYREALACFEEAQRLGYPQAAQAIAQLRRVLGK